MKMTIALSFVCLLGATMHAQPETSRLSSMRETYEQRKQVFLSDYTNNLTTLLEAAMRAGNLEALLELRKEINRFQEEMTILPPNDAKIIWHRASIQYHTNLFELQRQYQGALDQYIKHLVASDRLDEAITSNAEKGSIELDMDRLSQFLPGSLPSDVSQVVSTTPLEVIPRTGTDYAVTKATKGARPWSNRKYAITQLPPELEGSIVVVRPMENNRDPLNGEVIVTKKCMMYVALMWNYLGRVQVTDSQFRALEASGWTVLKDTFATSTAGEEEWLWKVIAREIAPGRIGFTPQGTPTLVVMLKDISD